jgi:hypothetical protein
MFAGVALAVSELPVGLIERHRLRRRVHERGGEPEVDGQGDRPRADAVF